MARRRIGNSQVKFGAGTVGVAMVLLSAGPVSAYRPFVSTDAAVADLKELEIELGAPSRWIGRGARTRLRHRA